MLIFKIDSWNNLIASRAYHIGCKEAMILCQFCIQPTASPTMLSGNGRNKGLYQNWRLNCCGETNCFCFIPFDLVKIYVSKHSKNLFSENKQCNKIGKLQQEVFTLQWSIGDTKSMFFVKCHCDTSSNLDPDYRYFYYYRFYF